MLWLVIAQQSRGHGEERTLSELPVALLTASLTLSMMALYACMCMCMCMSSLICNDYSTEFQYVKLQCTVYVDEQKTVIN